MLKSQTVGHNILRVEPKPTLFLSSASTPYFCTATCWKRGPSMDCNTFKSEYAGSLHIIRWIKQCFSSASGQLKYFLECFTRHREISIIMPLQIFTKHKNICYVFFKPRFNFSFLCLFFFLTKHCHTTMKLH